MVQTQSKFFGTDRIGRLRYLAHSIVYMVLAVGMFLAGLGLIIIGKGSDIYVGLAVFLFLVSVVFTVIFYFLPQVRRLHDLGQSGWWSLLSLVPLVGLFVQLYLLFARGQSESNQYGTPEPAADVFMLWLLIILCLVILVPMMVVFQGISNMM